MKYKIGVDVDIPGDIVDVIKREHPSYYDEEKLFEESPNRFVPNIWEMEKCFNATKEQIEQVYWYDYTSEIMGDGTPIEENVSYLKKLLEESEHTFVCVTSQKEHARYHTLNWLGKQGLNFETIYFRKSAEKWLVEIDYIIDDSPNVYNHWKNNRGSDKGFLMIDRPHNSKVTPTHKVSNIEEAIKIINDK
mgnify:CR=1 FL=1